jgi:hypothetical protein
MSLLHVSPFLRRVLLLDAAASAATGLLMLLGANSLTQLFGLPVALMQYAGISLFPFVALLVFLATREHLSPRVVWAVIAVNALWTTDSLLLLVSRWVTPTGLGFAFVVAQALAVAAFAALEYHGLRKSESFVVSGR